MRDLRGRGGRRRRPDRAQDRPASAIPVAGGDAWLDAQASYLAGCKHHGLGQPQPPSVACRGSAPPSSVPAPSLCRCSPASQRTQSALGALPASHQSRPAAGLLPCAPTCGSHQRLYLPVATAPDQPPCAQHAARGIAGCALAGFHPPPPARGARPSACASRPAWLPPGPRTVGSADARQCSPAAVRTDGHFHCQRST